MINRQNKKRSKVSANGLCCRTLKEIKAKIKQVTPNTFVKCNEFLIFLKTKKDVKIVKGINNAKLEIPAVPLT